VKAYWVSGVDVHLDHAAVHGRADLLQGRARPAVEDEIELVLLTDLRSDLLLDVLQHLRTQLDRPGLVDPVHVAEGEGGDVAALLTGTENLDRPQSVLYGRVELVVDLVRPVISAPGDRVGDGVRIASSGAGWSTSTRSSSSSRTAVGHAHGTGRSR
jgi:hypothetical protein